jgi:uncharacterized protein YgbK (DUF1537 family)
MPDVPDIRILADDLTGALDSAAAFAGKAHPLNVRWRGSPKGPGAFDATTREGPGDMAADRHRDLAPWLLGGAIAFKKVDSLLRGHWAREAAALASVQERLRLVVAPAFPFQNRQTRGGRQWQDRDHPLAIDIAETLQAAGIAGNRFVVRDATTDSDLDRIVAEEAELSEAVLWVGSGGLAAALARRSGMPGSRATPRLDGPLLGLVGSGHPVTRAQIGALDARDPAIHITLQGDEDRAAQVRRRIGAGRSAIVTVAFAGTQADAARAIASRFEHLLDGMARPAALFVSGGETLRGIADALGADALFVEGEVEPGLPISRLHGGHWDGLPVLSKSGAFGRRDLLLDLVHHEP